MPSALAPLAAALATRLDPAGGASAFYLAADERRAQALAGLLGQLAPDLRIAHLPAWDCLPFDRIAPSRRIMGRRMGVLRWCLDPHNPPHLVVTTPAAVLQRVPPRDVHARAHLDIRIGQTLDLDALGDALTRLGYAPDEQVDEPGTFAVRGRVVDIFPAAAELPCRIEHEDGHVGAIRSYHPQSQRTEAETEHLIVDPASEIVGSPSAAEAASDDVHRLSAVYERLESVFDYLPEADVLTDTDAAAAAGLAAAQIDDAKADAGTRAAADGLYIDLKSWRAALAGRHVAVAGDDGDAGIRTVPRFADDVRPVRAFASFCGAVAAGATLVLAARQPRARAALVSTAEAHTHRHAVHAVCWRDVLEAPRGGMVTLDADLPAGFASKDGLIVVAATDLLGDEGAGPAGAVPPSTLDVLARTRFGVGDVVVHIDHGVAILDGLETIDAGAGTAGHAIALRYADDARLMVPVDEIDRIWRYGADADAVTLDKLDGHAWPKRRKKIEATIAETATHLAAMAAEKARRSAAKLTPPADAMARFCARFPYAPTPDQIAAFAAVRDDLARGRPMDRLVCGDVGFGKTEVALRAAAATLFAGKQVALIAPTTVLVRQHVDTLRRRFAPFGIAVSQLSRVVKPADAKGVKAGLADGTIRLVVGTQALAAKDVIFADLGLTIIDEEQRFGARDKAMVRARGATAHLLTLTATPIPRTLQAALAGLQDISVLATPPVQRQAIRTLATPFTGELVREALTREARRGGQSLVVCPRVEDIAPMTAELKKLVPKLKTLVAHGKMPAQRVDETMVAFAAGDGDVLLATNIVETGLDIPNANTMLVWRADLFGLAQLHQLRGRVGRGTRRGAVFLLSDPDTELTPAAQKRLHAMERHDRVGGGFSISAEDLDQRGAGDLIGETQAGHVKLIGLSLYQTMLAAALDGRGADLGLAVRPDMRLGVTGRIPHDYVGDDEVRLDLYARLAAPAATAGLDALEAEIEDRFGPIPPEVAQMLRVARLRNACDALDITRLDAGPQAIAVTPRRPPTAELIARIEHEADVRWRNGRFVRACDHEEVEARFAAAESLIETLAAGPLAPRGRPG